MRGSVGRPAALGGGTQEPAVMGMRIPRAGSDEDAPMVSGARAEALAGYPSPVWPDGMVRVLRWSAHPEPVWEPVTPTDALRRPSPYVSLDTSPDGVTGDLVAYMPHPDPERLAAGHDPLGRQLVTPELFVELVRMHAPPHAPPEPWGDLTAPPAPPAPALLTAADGSSVIPSGRSVLLFGWYGGGKTWIAALAALEVARAGSHVAWIDAEMSVESVAGRLRALGVTDGEWLGRHVGYWNAGRLGASEAQAAAIAWLEERGPRRALVVVDSVSGLGGALNDAAEWREWHQAVSAPVTDRGWTPLLLDHMAKTRDRDTTPRSTARGSGDKMATVDVAIEVEGAPWNAVRQGTVTLRVAKDRHGDLPAAAGEVLATVRGEPLEGRQLALTVETEQRGATENDRLRAAVLEAVCEAGEIPSNTELRRAVREQLRGVRNADIDLVADDLDRGGQIRIRRGGAGRATTYAITSRGAAEAASPDLARPRPTSTGEVGRTTSNLAPGSGGPLRGRPVGRGGPGVDDEPIGDEAPGRGQTEQEMLDEWWDGADA